MFEFVLLFLLGAALGISPAEGEHHDESKVLVNEFLRYMSCDDHRNSCQQQPATEDAPCEQLYEKWAELVKLHPELAKLKIYFLKALEEQMKVFETECGQGESVIEKFLDLIVYIAQSLKLELPVPQEIEVDESLIVGSVRGTPGVHFPNYSEVPITSFTCDGKKYIPGFYADLETGCQVFHVCYEHRRESFLCPIGTTFNQPILACDYWYSSNCSQSPIYHEVNDHEVTAEEVVDEQTSDVEDMITAIIDVKKPEALEIPEVKKEELKKLLAFLPVKAKVLQYKVLAAKKDAVITKAAVAKAAVKADVKIAKTVKAVKADVKIAKAVAAKKIVKAKVVPVVMAAKAPIVVKAASKLVPLTKVAMVAPIKAKVAAAAISPLTKKALALGYMKLLKAKKMAVMG